MLLLMCVLLCSYVCMGLYLWLLWLVVVGVFNFFGIFFYIVLVLVFVMYYLKLGEGGFVWLFIFIIGGMMMGLFLFGCMVGWVVV